MKSGACTLVSLVATFDQGCRDSDLALETEFVIDKDPQVIIGLSLLSYAVNLFIFGVGGVKSNAAPLLEEGVPISSMLSTWTS